MRLTVQFTEPLFNGVACGHCDDLILRSDQEKYVKFLLGNTMFSFHEGCFSLVLDALNQFNIVFLEKRMSENAGRVN